VNGVQGSDKGEIDADFPIRLADAYLMYAECAKRCNENAQRHRQLSCHGMSG
jgi:hypothetical protein